MKYGESAFDLLYLAFAIGVGVALLGRRRGGAVRLMGVAALVLGLGDAFHLVPRVLNYFIPGDFTAALGFGKLVTSLTMTAFYGLLYRLWLIVYGEREDVRITRALLLLAAARAFFCVLPQNRWLENGSSALWGIVRNVPFAAIGCLLIALYYKKRAAFAPFSSMWLWMALSFLFYIPVAVLAGFAPMLGMLMLPKTVCYILMLSAFWRAARQRPAEGL